jgi:hypothetical protein
MLSGCAILNFYKSLGLDPVCIEPGHFNPPYKCNFILPVFLNSKKDHPIYPNPGHTCHFLHIMQNLKTTIPSDFEPDHVLPGCNEYNPND